MSTCSLELRTRRDFEALLACVRTIAFLHQRRRKRASSGEIEAIIDDNGAARALLMGSFFAAAAESLPAAIRNLVSAIGDKEEITRTQLRERVIRCRSTFYYQVGRAIDLGLLHEEKRTGKRILTRNGDVPLPEERPPLPEVETVEGLFFGVPAPIGDYWFHRFIADFQSFGGADGITAAEWAAWVGQPVKVVRRRLRRLRSVEPARLFPEDQALCLSHCRDTNRFAPRTSGARQSDAGVQLIAGLQLCTRPAEIVGCPTVQRI